jgi:hypothetical protein
MNDIQRLPLMMIAILFQLIPSALKADTTPSQKPNIVFFLIDDLGYADCGFNGGQEIRTPNIDKLANGGAILESHYVQPVCSPTRAALMGLASGGTNACQCSAGSGI